MRALQAMAVSRPPPRAMDATAATVGLGPLSRSEQKLSLILQALKEFQGHLPWTEYVPTLCWRVTDMAWLRFFTYKDA